MSDSSQGDRWWQASDGKWYPPHSKPAQRQPPSFGTIQNPDTSKKPGWQRELAIVLGVLVVGVVVVLVVVASTLGSADDDEFASTQPEPTAEPEPTREEAKSEPQPTSEPEPKSQPEEPTSEPDPTPSLYELTTILHENKPFVGVNRYVDTVVLTSESVEHDRLIETLNSYIEMYRGEAHAISVQVKSDEREPAPGAFGVFDWAPGGVWGDAAEGDAVTWSGYEWGAANAPSKLDGATCAKPGEQDFVISDLFWNANRDVPEDELLAEIAESLAITVDGVAESVARMIEWQFC